MQSGVWKMINFCDAKKRQIKTEYWLEVEAGAMVGELLLDVFFSSVHLLYNVSRKKIKHIAETENWINIMNTKIFEYLKNKEGQY